MQAPSLLSSALGWLFRNPLKTTEMLQQFPLDLDKTESISSLWLLPFLDPRVQLSYSLMEVGYRCTFPCFSLLPIFLSSGLLANVHLLYKLATKEGSSDGHFSFNCGVGFWPNF